MEHSCICGWGGKTSTLCRWVQRNTKGDAELSGGEENNATG